MKHIKYIIFAFTLFVISAYGQKKINKMNTALVIIDIQNDYFKEGAMPLNNPEQASANAKKLLQDFRSKKMPIIHIQHIATRADATFFLPNTKGAEIHLDVAPQKGEKVITKHFPNSFRNTELLEYLKSQKIERLVICGMMTHMCIDATTRAAKDFGFENIVVGDACATRDLVHNGEKVAAHEVQKAFLSALNYFYAKVITTEEFLFE